MRNRLSSGKSEAEGKRPGATCIALATPEWAWFVSGSVLGQRRYSSVVEQLICNQQVVGSSPTAGSLSQRDLRRVIKSVFALSGVSVLRRHLKFEVNQFRNHG
jgi:hypothetical protein